MTSATLRPDVLVLGGNPGGCAAAVTAARLGLSVVLLEASRTFGGNNANGVFAFDTADPRVLGGIAVEMRDRIRAHYRDAGIRDPLFERRADQVWESRVAARAWADLLASEPGIAALTEAVAVGARVEAGRIVEVRWLPAANASGDLGSDEGAPSIVAPDLVIDASYEGDVLAWTGVPHRIGREARSRREPHAGRVYTSDAQGGPDGLPPHSVLPGSTGEADDAIMAFACRLHCRWYEDDAPGAAHRIQSPPPGYDPTRFAWSPQARGPDGEPIYFASIYVLVGDKVLVNRTVRGNELAGPARDYILAHPRERGAIRQRFVDHALGFLYFIQTEGGCPRLGLADDEFMDNGHVPYRLYVREGRRILGLAEVDEWDLSPFASDDGLRPPLRPDAIAVGDWPIESRACVDAVEPGYSMPEGWFFHRVGQAPYQVPYGSLVPREVDNLLVCGSVGATHVGFSALRVESTRIHMGMAAGVAAAQARATGRLPAALDVGPVQAELARRGAQLIHFSDLPASHPHFAAVQWAGLRGVVPRDARWRFRPDEPLRWAEAAEVVVRCLNLPISVTGLHFDGIGRGHPALRWVETLFDLGCRAGIDLFGLRRLGVENPIGDLLHMGGPRLISFDCEGTVSWPELRALLDGASRALGLRATIADRPASAQGSVTRAEIAQVLHGLVGGV